MNLFKLIQAFNYETIVKIGKYVEQIGSVNKFRQKQLSSLIQKVNQDWYVILLFFRNDEIIF
jgi:hypothetical protein